MANGRVLWLVAGPNGVGKTTYARRYIEAFSGSRNFVNLDEIARGLSPFDPEAERVRAARVSLEFLRDTLEAANGSRRSVTLENTLAGLTHLRTIDLAHKNGWLVHLLYFAVRAVDVSLARIARRVSEGGHDVPETDVRRRFERSIANFDAYAAKTDLWRVFDNNAHQPVAIAEGRQGCRSFLDERASGIPPKLMTAISVLPPCPEV
ncbi:MAG: AAA family ATPase [Rhizobiaceae bacterium]